MLLMWYDYIDRRTSHQDRKEKEKMKTQQLFEQAKAKYQTHLEIFNIDLLEESYQIYRQYKERGGKKTIARLEEMFQTEKAIQENETRTQDEKNERNNNFRKLYNLINEKYCFYDCVSGEIVTANRITSMLTAIKDRIDEYNDITIIEYMESETNDNGEKLIFFKDVK